MKCQKNRTCVKQPSDVPPMPADTKWCTGCDKPGRDRKPSSNEDRLRVMVRLLRKELRAIVDNHDPHTDSEDNDVAQYADCFCSRCIAVRALKIHAKDKETT